MPTTTPSAWSQGDPGAESVFLWTKDKKGVDRRGAGPRTRPLGGPARDSASTSAPGRSRSGAPSPATCSRCASSTWRRGPAPTRNSRARPSAPTPPPGGATTTTTCSTATEAARGDHHLRGRRHRRARLGESRLQLPLARQYGPVRRRAPDHRLSRRARRPHQDDAQLRRPQGRARADPSAFRHDGPRAQGGRHRRTRSRRATPAATSTTGASARARRCTTRSPCPARLFSVGDPHASQGDSRAVRHRHRVLADRHLPVHPAQEGGSRRHAARGPRLPDDRDAED